jgi:predicted  nucleic acid-binding Zn-ribbon protein
MVVEEKLEKLRALQDILSEKINLEKDIQEIPKLLITQEELLARLKESYIKKNQEYKSSKVSEGEFRNLLIQAEADREKSEKNMDSISTQREYEALDKEIRDASEKEQQYRKELQREERALADLDEQIKQSNSLIEQQEKDLSERRASIEAEVAKKKAELIELAQQEQGITPGLDPEDLFKFERIIRNKGGRGIVAIKSGVCMGCHMILPAQFANMVRKGEDTVYCPYCSRILFYEESEPGEEEFFNVEDMGSLTDPDDMEDEEEEEEEEEEEKVNGDYED